MLTSDFGTKLFHHSSPQGVSTSVLCRDVAWLTEEIVLRNKDVSFGGSLVEVVHYSLCLLAPHLIIATVPPRSVCQKKKKILIKYHTGTCVSYQKSNFPFDETSVFITVFYVWICVSLPLGKTLWLYHVLLLLPHFTFPSRPRLSHIPLYWKLLVVSEFAHMYFG